MLIFILVGIAILRHQCQQLYRGVTELCGKQTTSEQNNDLKSSNIELREIHKFVQCQQRQSYQELASELESMRKMQRDMKSNLTHLQKLVGKVSAQRVKEK